LMKLAPGIAAENKILNNRVTYGPAAIRHTDIAISEIFEKGISFEFSKAYVNQRLVLEESNLLAQIVIGVSIFLILLVQGYATIMQGGNWSALLVYLFAFGLFATSFAKTVRMLTSINRFYPAVNAYGKFVVSLAEQLENEKQNSNKYLNKDPLLLDIDQQSITLNRGIPISYVTSDIIDNYQLSNLIKEIYFTSDFKKEQYCKKAWLVSAKKILINTSISEVLSMSENLKRSEILSEINQLTGEEEVESLPADLDKILSEEDVDRLQPQLLFLLLLISAKYNDNDIIVIDEACLRAFDNDVRENIFHYLQEKIIVISFALNTAQNLDKYGANVAIFADSKKIIGYVELDGEYNDKVDKYLQQLESSKKANDIGDGALDEDLDEDY
jgi:hypothetical protein